MAALLDHLLAHAETVDAAVMALLDRLAGAYALAMVFDGYPDLMFVFRQESPLAVGHGATKGDGISEMAACSDAPALAASVTGAVVAQWLAYDVAVERGTDVDRPRNLAKSVFVESAGGDAGHGFDGARADTVCVCAQMGGGPAHV